MRNVGPRSVSLSARYINRHGTIEEKDFTGLEARIFQHEYDHLEGLTYLDRLEDTRDLVTEKEFERIISQNG